MCNQLHVIQINLNLRERSRSLRPYLRRIRSDCVVTGSRLAPRAPSDLVVNHEPKRERNVGLESQLFPYASHAVQAHLQQLPAGRHHLRHGHGDLKELPLPLRVEVHDRFSLHHLHISDQLATLPGPLPKILLQSLLQAHPSLVRVIVRRVVGAGRVEIGLEAMHVGDNAVALTGHSIHPHNSGLLSTAASKSRMRPVGVIVNVDLHESQTVLLSIDVCKSRALVARKSGGLRLFVR
mmetsp:Transcript_9394/g.20579  ORF Transcript_9394/g.20579 Transcript_9394/m.20579 type:complete len:237 (-) Transcript_9394:96-806(-)